MTKAQRKNAKLLLTAACLTWVAVAGWANFSDIPDDAIQHHASPEVKAQMKAECEGTFKQRYDCKEAIVIEKGRETFWNLASRLLIVVVPAIAAGIIGSMVIRRIPDDKPPPAPRDDDWKMRAQSHIAHPREADQSSEHS